MVYDTVFVHIIEKWCFDTIVLVHDKVSNTKKIGGFQHHSSGAMEIGIELLQIRYPKYIYIYLCMCIYIYTCVCVPMCMYACMYVCMYVSM